MQHPIFTSFLRDLETHERDVEQTDIQRYHAECWATCKSIYTAVKKLKIAELCIEISYQKCPKEHEIAEYIEFHIENYLIRSLSVYDRVLQFVNCLCDIQMSKELVGHISITTNRKVEGLGLKNKLKKVKSACDAFRLQRNSVLHHDNYRDEMLEWVDTALKAKHILDGDFEHLGISVENIADKIAIVVTGKLQEFRLNSENIDKSINHFMNDAQKIYDSKSLTA